MNKILKSLLDSPIIQIPITLIVYAFYASIIGFCISPSIFLIIFGINKFIIGINLFTPNGIINILIFSLLIGVSIYIYFIFGIIIMGVMIKIISLGIKEGKHDMMSFTMFRWLIYSGIFMIVVNTILPLNRMTFFSTLFFRIIGCKIGKNVYIDTPNLNDPMFLEMGNNVVVGGLTNISCHIFENNKLVLGKIKIGDNTLIGTNCYILPNVTIGKNCNIGMYSFIRKNKEIPDGAVISAISGMPLKKVIKFENE